MNNGYVKLWRKSMINTIFDDANLWKLWTMCLMLASHKEHEIIPDGLLKKIIIKQGQFITGRSILHQDYYPKKHKENKSPITLWRWMQFLQKCEYLNIKSTTKYSIVSILNWELYQQDVQQKSIYKDKEKKASIGNTVKEIISYLNTKAKTNFRSNTAATTKYIAARLNEGFSVADFKKVIDNKCAKWIGGEYEKFLRPQTLFGTKFESYLNEKHTIKQEIHTI